MVSVNISPEQEKEARIKLERETALAPAVCSTASPEKASINDIKMACNNLVWMYGPDSLTLKEADVIACNIQTMVMLGKPMP